MDYRKSIKSAVKELEYRVKFYNGVEMSQLLDEPIYTENKELKEEFTDEYGFDVTAFVSFLVRNSETLKSDYNEDFEVVITFK